MRLLLMLTFFSGTLAAQETGPVFASLSAGTGIVQTPSALRFVNGRGTQLMLRVGHRLSPRWALTAEVGHLRLGRFDGVVPAFLCAQDVPDCAPFTGPLKSTTVDAGVTMALPVGIGQLGFDLAPSWTWFSASDSTARSTPGISLGTTLAFGRGSWHPLLEARYRQALRPGSLVSSVFQLGIGLGWH